MKKYFTVILLLLITLARHPFASAQTDVPETLWQHAYGGSKNDEFRGAALTPDGGFIATGYTQSKDGDVSSKHGSSDVWVVKADSLGAIEWEKTYGGTAIDWGRNVSLTADGGYLVAAYTQSIDQQVTGNHGDYDYWILRLDATGHALWKKCFGGTGLDNAYRAIETSDGSIIVIGFTLSTDGDITINHGQQDFLLMKLNANGKKLWTKTFGGSLDEQAACVIETNDHNYLVAGFSESSDGDVKTNKGGRDVWILKLSQYGKIIWKKVYGGTKEDAARWIEKTPDKGFMIAGYSASDNKNVTVNYGGFDYWVIKIDSNGSLQWQHSYGGGLDDYPYCIQRCTDGNYVVCGSSLSGNHDVTEQFGAGDFWVVKIDTIGNLLWQKSFGGSGFDEARTILQTADENFLIAGFINSDELTHSVGSPDAWVVRTCIPPAAIITPLGNLNICNTGSVTLSAGSQNNTTYQWLMDGTQITGATNDEYVASSPADYNVTVTNSTECSKLSETVTVYTSCKTAEATVELTAFISPNPASEKFELHLPSPMETTMRLTLVDLAGKEIIQKTIQADAGVTNITIETPPSLPAGTYLLKVQSSAGTQVIKVMIE